VRGTAPSPEKKVAGEESSELGGTNWKGIEDIQHSKVKAEGR
jgi:hypothetical protein